MYSLKFENKVKILYGQQPAKEKLLPLCVESIITTSVTKKNCEVVN